MNNFYIEELKKGSVVHFVGIGGISMSALAEILIDRGYRVSGSDMKESHITKKLEDMGAKIFIGHDEKNIDGADLVVYTAAVKQDNPELIGAKNLNIPSIERPVLLGALMRGYKNCICVAGTHGKTTTTSMMSHVLMNCNTDPTILLGGELNLIGGNVRVGDDKYFLCEACEYCRSFLQFFPTVSLITNVEADHLDYYRDLDDIKDAFSDFADLAGESGYAVVCGDDKDALDCTENTKADVITYGIGTENKIKPENLIYTDGCGEFDVDYNGSKIHVKLNVVGKHNVLNALACFAVSYVCGLDGEKVAEGLEAYTGVNRRFQKKGEIGGALVVDDYAHHPTEIKTTLAAAKAVCKNKLYVAFQPHTYTRTLTLFDEFCGAFDDADEVIVANIYAAREKDEGKIHSSHLSDALVKRGVNALNLPDFESIKNYLKEKAEPGDIIITMGAGDIYKVGEMLLKDVL